MMLLVALPRWSWLALLILSMGACVPKPATPTPPDLLAAARRALGPGADSVRTIWAVATVASSSGRFEARIASAVDGRVRLGMGQALRAGVDSDRGWRCDSLGQAVPLDSVTRTFVRGHSLHMLALAPVWLREPSLDAATRRGPDSVLTLRFLDELGAPLRLYFRATDTLPVGGALIDHTGAGPRDVQVFFSNWEVMSGLRLFRTAVFLHGENRFEYTYRQLEVNILSDTAFTPSCGPGDG